MSDASAVPQIIPTMIDSTLDGYIKSSYNPGHSQVKFAREHGAELTCQGCRACTTGE